LGALGFLIDMLNYQPALAKKLFFYDEEKGELNPVMGRVHNSIDTVSSVTADDGPLMQEIAAASQMTVVRTPEEGLEIVPDPLSIDARLDDQLLLGQSTYDAAMTFSIDPTDGEVITAPALADQVKQIYAAPLDQPASVEFEEDDLQNIFLEEAREVIGNAVQAIETLLKNPADTEHLTILRRSFHTLKGSSRMVKLGEFGEASWAMEQVLTTWLAEQKAASREFLTLCSEVIAGLEHWVDDIAAGRDARWSATPFCSSAEAMRINGHYSSLDLSGEAHDFLLQPGAENTPAFDAIDKVEIPQIDTKPEFAIKLDAVLNNEPVVESHAQIALIAEDAIADLEDLDFDSLFAQSSENNVLPAEINMAADDLVKGLAARPQFLEAIELSPADFERYFQVEARMPAISATINAAAPELPRFTLKDELAAVPETAAFESLPIKLQDEISATDVAEIEETPERIFSFPAADSFNNEQQQEEEQEQEQEQENETFKVIGGLRIGIPLYNVYLNEADEWSRCLVNELAEWALESDQPISASTVAFAHSLAGSSGTVGFTALSEMARSLEHALENSRNHHSHGAYSYGQLFVEASEDIRQLLHQFAAGFLKQPQPGILERLNQLEFFGSVSPRLFEGDQADYGPVGQDKAVPAPVVLPEASDTLTSLLEAQAVVKPFVKAMEPTLLQRDGQAQLAEDIAVALKINIVQKGGPPFSLTADILVPGPTAADSLSTARISLPALTPVPAAISHPVSNLPLAGHEDVNNDIDAVDAIDLELFPIFEEECAELMPCLATALRLWAENPGELGARLEVLRVLHTLKGSARLAGAMRLGEMAHHIESDIAYVGSDAAASQAFEPLLIRFDWMQAAFELLRQNNQDLAQAPMIDTETAVSMTMQPGQKDFNIPMPDAGDEFHGASNVDSGRKVAIPRPQAMVIQPLRQAANSFIRVRTRLLDCLVNQAGEVMITRSRLEAQIGQLRISLNDMTANLARLRQQLRDIELGAETQMQSRLALSKEAQAGFDPLEFDRFTRVQELTRMMAESVNDVATVQRTLQRTVEATEDDLIAQGRQTRELQRDLLRTRMVEFESVAERLYRVVRQASKETGKQVRLDLQGGSLEMDRGMLDRMMPAFEHLLRNCVIHGIESPQARADAGKELVGVITINLRQEGNDVSVEISDDGAGLDLALIRKHGVRLGLLTPDQLMDDQVVGNLIFLPGFSTAEHVTELAGRGIGMDVVRSGVIALGGRIDTSTVTGKSTQFNMVLPLTTAVTQVVMIRAGALSVAVPANLVDTVRRASLAELEQAYRTGSLDFAGEAVPFYWSGALLQASHHSVDAQTKTSLIIVFRSASRRIALHVDEVLGNREVVIKNLGPQLSRLPGLTGMSVLPSGAVVLIYNPVALADVYGAQARAWMNDRPGQSGTGGAGHNAEKDTPLQSVAPLILVVDDSITVRRVTQRLLLRDGYRVAMAGDGLQALERLTEEMPAVVLSDIEMPRMDGFDLARNIRADKNMKDLPIIMITSRIAEKHREHAMELGVNHYLGKPYSEEELLRLVQHYCSAPAIVIA
jgi:chemosensory pili system protein ChpA (sensor histidine kinase/response regulator)